MPDPELTIVMPVYNDRATVVAAVISVLETDFPVGGVELLVVDDGSDDGSRELLVAHDWPQNVHVLLHERNTGKGAAIQTALAVARGRYTTVLDADLEVGPEGIVSLLRALGAGEADAVFGARDLVASGTRATWYVLGNRLVTGIANVLYRGRLRDMMTAHKLMRTDLFRSLALNERGFGIEAEIAARLLRAGARIVEVPVDYRARGHKEGKKLTTVDGFRVVRTLLRCRFDATGPRLSEQILEARIRAHEVEEVTGAALAARDEPRDVGGAV